MRSLAADREARPAPARRAVPVAVPVSIGLAWVGLLLAELLGSPIGHGALAGGSVPLVAALGVFGVAWVAMVVAMMLPASYPVLRAFAVIDDRHRRAGRIAAFLIGYVAV